MSVLNYKKRSLRSGPHLAGVILILAGIFAIASPYLMEGGSSELKSLIVGLVAIFLGLIIVTSYTGLVLDLEKSIGKEYTAVLGFKIGQWEKFTNPAAIVLDKSDYSFRTTKNGITPSFIQEVTEYRVSMLDHNHRLLYTMTYESKDKALQTGQQLASNYAINLDNQLA